EALPPASKTAAIKGRPSACTAWDGDIVWYDAGLVGSTVSTTWSFAHHEQRFRTSGELIAGNLNPVAHVHHIGHDRPCEARHLLAPVPVAVDRHEWRHTLLTLAPIEPLILYEIREVFAFPRLFAETLDQSAVGIDHFMGLELDVIVFD